MSDSPLSASPYEVLGVSSNVGQDELRKAYRRLLRETHPDTGGSAARFNAVQVAWERIGDADSRASYDRGAPHRDSSPYSSGGSSASGSSASGASGSPSGSPFAARPPSPAGSELRARSYGHPGGRAREGYLELLREWAGRGTAIADPYDPALVRSAPREIRHLLAEALAEEATARIISGLGMGFTIWSCVATNSPEYSIDHIVLGPAGLFAIRSEDWGEPVRLLKGEVVGDAIADQDAPIHDLHRYAKKLARSLGVRFTAVAIVVPDEALAEPMQMVERGRYAGSVLIRRSVLPQLVRVGPGSSGISVGDVFEVRTRLQNGIRFA
jgi:molecular chaperone DnaJ